MGFSVVAGITLIANILTILVFVAEFMECDISDIMTMAELTSIEIVNIIRLITFVLDLLFTGIMIIVYIGTYNMFGPVTQYLLMVVQYLLYGIGICGIIKSVILFSGTIFEIVAFEMVIEPLIIGANFQRSVQNRPPQTPLKTD